jgi:hypothetical protein
MSREGPINFGKPLLYLVLAGVAGGGFYLYKTWPARYETSGWLVDFPTHWEAAPFDDPTSPGKVVAHGPLLEEGQEGVAWVTENRHGTLDWPRFVIERIPGGAPDVTREDEIAHKKSLLFEYSDEKEFRYTGVATQRGDAVIIVAIGAPKHLFDTNKERFEKCVKSLRVMR